MPLIVLTLNSALHPTLTLQLSTALPVFRCTRAHGGALTATGAGAGGLLTEQRAVAVARCISSGEGGRSEIRSRAVLALANAASFPFSDGLRELVQVGFAFGKNSKLPPAVGITCSDTQTGDCRGGQAPVVRSTSCIG